jgi:hypothetical protein
MPRKVKQLTPEQLAAWNAKQCAKRKRKSKARSQRRRDRTARTAHITKRLTSNINRESAQEGWSILTTASLKRPPLTYIDSAGRVWEEDYRCAEQLIRDFEEKVK